MQDGKWTADSNECLEIILASGSDESSDLSFSPSFTHSIFDEETIFGYANLSIKLLFSAGSLRQCLSISYDDKHNKADDVEGTLYEFLAADYSKDVDQFRKSILDDDFCPTGTRIASYVLDRKGKQTELDIKPGNHDFDEAEVVYEAYASDWQTKGWIDWHRRMQIFNRLLIDGASDIDEDDLSWSFVSLFERRKSSTAGKQKYAFVGFVSLFAFFYFSPSLHERRQKLAQFFVLPPFQGQGHGAALYTICRRQALESDTIAEFAVEDPSEAFEDLRDKCDLASLARDDEFQNASLHDPKGSLESCRKRLKLAQRQFYRLLEIKTLRALSDGKSKDDLMRPRKGESDERKKFRLAVKKRLYLFNRDTLDQLDDGERKEKLQQAYENVVSHYHRLLATI